MTGKLCLVTGATSGIGRAAAVALARLGARVVIHGRNPDKLAARAQEIRSAAGTTAVETIQADFASLAEVRRMADEFRTRFAGLDVLVNNAGLSVGKRRESRDGHELMLAVNHLAPFLLTNLLLDRLGGSALSRIVNVTSAMYAMARFDFADLQSRRHYSGLNVYAVTKLFNIMFTIELAQRLAGKNVAVNAVAPGMVRTNIGMEEGGLFSLSKKVMDALMGRTPEKGADTVVWLAAAPETASVTGGYFKDRRQLPVSRIAGDLAAARRLWELSAVLTDLSSDRTA